MKTIGVIGLGIIGGAWARRYAAAGVLAGSWNRTPQPDAPAWKASPEEVAAAADLVQIVVADPPAVQGVLERIRPRLGPGKLVVQSSTIDPASSTRFAGLVRGTGARYVEAPFTGSKPAAEAGQTVFYLGGDPANLAEIEPLLRHVSEVRIRIGTEVQAATLKLAMNLNIALQMEALVESLTMVRQAGVPDDVYFAALGGNVACSGLTKLKEPKLRAGDFSPQFSVKHMHKDMRLASVTAGAGALPLLEGVRERLRLAEEKGSGEEDFSALLKYL